MGRKRELLALADNDGLSPLMHAVDAGHAGCVEALLNAAASLGCGDAAVIIGARRMRGCGGGRRSDAEGTSVVDATNKRPNIGDRDAEQIVAADRACAVVRGRCCSTQPRYYELPSYAFS